MYIQMGERWPTTVDIPKGSTITMPRNTAETSHGIIVTGMSVGDGRQLGSETPGQPEFLVLFDNRQCNF